MFRSLAEQQYDSSFKEFIREQIADILPPLLEGVVHSKDIVFEQELTVEVLRPAMRWELDAERNVREHIVSMYPLLPTMQGANAELLSQAIQELAEYYKHDESRLARQLVWLGILLRRADTVAPLDKAKVEERLTMYERLWEEDPKIQKYVADKSEEKMKQGLEQGLEQGRTQGEIQASQKMVIEYVQHRFPTIAELALQRVTQIKRVDDLDKLFRLTISAPDEATARWVIDNYAA